MEFDKIISFLSSFVEQRKEECYGVLLMMVRTNPETLGVIAGACRRGDFSGLAQEIRELVGTLAVIQMIEALRYLFDKAGGNDPFSPN